MADKVRTIQVVYALDGTDADASAALAAGRGFEITDATGITNYQGSGYTKTGLNLTPGATYTPYVRVEEVDSNAPERVTGLTATPGDNQMSLSWTALSPTPTGYKLYRSTDGLNWGSPIYTGTSTSYSDTTAVNGTKYYYKVCGYNASDDGLWSSAVSAEPALLLREETFQSAPTDVSYFQRQTVDTDRNVSVGDTSRIRYTITQLPSDKDIIKVVAKFNPSTFPVDAFGDVATQTTVCSVGLWHVKPDYTFKHLHMQLAKIKTGGYSFDLTGAFLSANVTQALSDAQVTLNTDYRFEMTVNKATQIITEAKLIKDSDNSVIHTFTDVALNNNLAELANWQPNRVDVPIAAANTSCSLAYDSTNDCDKAIYGLDNAAPFVNAETRIKYLKVTCL